MFRTVFFLLLATSTVSAQAISTAPALPLTVAVSAPAPRTAADTVQAIHKLFAKRRRVGGLLTVGAVSTHLALAGVSAAAEDVSAPSGGAYGFGMGSFRIGFGGFALIYGVVAAPVVGVGIQQLIAYSPKREAKVLAAFETTHRLPAKIKRQLRKHLR